MAGYSDQEKDHIIKDYFSPPGNEENPRCPDCGEVLRFNLDYAESDNRLLINVNCIECSTGFLWCQPQKKQAWKPLHLDYFVERYKMEKVIRCPIDDCYIFYAEFGSGVLEFRCPYCNNQGRITLPERRGNLPFG